MNWPLGDYILYSGSYPPADKREEKPMADSSEGAVGEWRRHGTLALAAAFGFSFMSFMTAAVGVFMGPLTDAFGWSRTELTAGMALAGVIAIFLSPVIGIYIDRWGSRRLAIPGVVISAVLIACFAFLSGSFFQWMILWALWGLASLLIQSTVWATAVAGVFNSARGLALGVTMSGTAIAQVVAPPLANWLIGDFGWRAAYAIMGLCWGGIALVLVLAFLYDAHDIGQRPPVAHSDEEGRSPLTGLTIPEAWRDSSLWRIALATFLILTATIAIVVHQFPILVEAGVTRDHAAWLVSLSGVAGVVGKLTTGALIDRYHARWVGGVTLASTAIAWPLMMPSLATPGLIVIGIVISGYAAGTKIQLCSYLTARYGGIKNYGVIFGFMTSVISLASAVGPLLAGVVHDQFGSYGPFLWAGVGISIVSGLLIFSLGAYPQWDSPLAANTPVGSRA
jgi:predicted MFS family arabinose efflux permease